MYKKLPSKHYVLLGNFYYIKQFILDKKDWLLVTNKNLERIINKVRLVDLNIVNIGNKYKQYEIKEIRYINMNILTLVRLYNIINSSEIKNLINSYIRLDYNIN